MNPASLKPDDRFARLAEEFVDNLEVTLPGDGIKTKKGFGSEALRVNGKIFAMLVREKLVVKLPKTRVDELVQVRAGERFDPRQDGRLMKEWLVLHPTVEIEWLALAKEALEFVGTKK